MKLRLSVFNGIFTIHRLPPDSEIPEQLYEEQFYNISKTDEELSIVCSSSILLHSEKSETGWSCIKVLGPLNFSLCGVLADISDVLANEGISIFAISTFDTDYLLVKSDKLPAAKAALQKAEHLFE